MPKQANIEAVDRLRQQLEKSSVVISTDFTGMSVRAMTDLRRALRASGVEFHVIKNSLAYLAAEAAGKPIVKNIIEGPTGIAFSSGDPVEPAKALVGFIRSTRASMRIRGGVLGEQTLTAAEVNGLAELPPKEQLVATLLGQLIGPVTSLVYTLNGPISGLVNVLQRHIEATGDEDGEK